MFRVNDSNDMYCPLKFPQNDEECNEMYSPKEFPSMDMYARSPVEMDSSNEERYLPTNDFTMGFEKSMPKTFIQGESRFSNSEIDLSNIRNDQRGLSKFLPRMFCGFDISSSESEPEYYFSSSDSEDEYPKYSEVAEAIALLAAKLEQIKLESPKYDEEFDDRDGKYSITKKRKLDVSDDEKTSIESGSCRFRFDVCDRDSLSHDRYFKRKKPGTLYSPPNDHWNGYIKGKRYWNNDNYTKIKKEHVHERSYSLDSISSRSLNWDSYSMNKENERKKRRNRNRSSRKRASVYDQENCIDFYATVKKEMELKKEKSSRSESHSKRSSKSKAGSRSPPKERKIHQNEYLPKTEDSSRKILQSKTNRAKIKSELVEVKDLKLENNNVSCINFKQESVYPHERENFNKIFRNILNEGKQMENSEKSITENIKIKREKSYGGSLHENILKRDSEDWRKSDAVCKKIKSEPQDEDFKKIKYTDS